jgi:hypothetical protein
MRPSFIDFGFVIQSQVPSEFLQQEQETTIENEGFILRYRTLELRFFTDEIHFGELSGKIRLRCLAKIDEIAEATRESTVVVFVQKPEDLRNQKLINYWGDGRWHSCPNLKGIYSQ